MPNDTPFPVFVNERNVKILTTCTGKTETSTLPSEQLLHGADKNNEQLRKETFWKRKVQSKKIRWQWF